MAKQKKIEDHSILQVNAEIIDSEIDDETVMMDVETGAYYGLDSIASVIWKKIKEPTKYYDLIESLVADYEVERQQCNDDVMPLLEQMLESNLITVQ